MITTSDRQPLESGNELVAISGRVINPTDREQNVPPIHAELRDKQTKQLVHSWTIAPPARVLAPRSSASFNSAEVDVPKGGDELTVTLGKWSAKLIEIPVVLLAVASAQASASRLRRAVCPGRRLDMIRAESNARHDPDRSRWHWAGARRCCAGRAG